VLSVIAPHGSDQQKDNLCGPYWAARVLNELGFSVWDGEAIDQDTIAMRAGTLLPDAHAGPDVPPGAVGYATYRYPLPTAPVARSGTSAGALITAIERASGGELSCVPLRGAWNVDRVERLMDDARQTGSRLIANLRTGRLWGSRPPVDIILAELEGKPVQLPTPDWDVGHFVELEMLIRGPVRSLVVVHDSYPTLGWDGRHVQPPRVLAEALLRGDGREGGVLAVVPQSRTEAMKWLAVEIGLQVGVWNNGAGS
jgi:hypothetical protein